MNNKLVFRYIRKLNARTYKNGGGVKNNIIITIFASLVSTNVVIQTLSIKEKKDFKIGCFFVFVFENDFIFGRFFQPNKADRRSRSGGRIKMIPEKQKL